MTPLASTVTKNSVHTSSASALASRDAQFEDAEPQPRGIGMGVGGLGFSTVTEVRIPKDEENQQSVVNAAAGAHFFQANYRDEYNPARPNSYEAHCEERLNKKKMEQVKRELERRQREQEREVRA